MIIFFNLENHPEESQKSSESRNTYTAYENIRSKFESRKRQTRFARLRLSNYSVHGIAILDCRFAWLRLSNYTNSHFQIAFFQKHVSFHSEIKAVRSRFFFSKGLFFFFFKRNARPASWEPPGGSPPGALSRSFGSGKGLNQQSEIFA